MDSYKGPQGPNNNIIVSNLESISYGEHLVPIRAIVASNCATKMDGAEDDESFLKYFKEIDDCLKSIEGGNI